MSKPKVLIFAPREEPPETINALEGIGCEVVFGDRDWQLPRTHARGRGGGGRARCGRAHGHLDAPHADQPAHHAGVAAAAHRREIHRRCRRHRHRGRDRPRHHGVPRADRIQLLRRRRDDRYLHALAVEEGRRARRRRARGQVAHRGKFRLLRRQPQLGRISRPDHRSRRPRTDRHAGGAAVGALARAHHRLRSLCAAGAFPHARRHGGRLRDASAGIRRGVVPRRAHQARPATCSARSSSS